MLFRDLELILMPLRYGRLIADVNVLKQPRMMRSVIEATVAVRFLVADVNALQAAKVTRLVTRQRIRHECFIADVNVLDTPEVMR